MVDEYLFHLLLIELIARVDIVVLLFAAGASVDLAGCVEIFRYHRDDSSHSHAQAQGIPSSVEQVGIFEMIFSGGKHICRIQQHQGTEVEVISHRPRLIVHHRVVHYASIRLQIAMVGVGQRRVYVGGYIRHSP